MQKRNRTNKTKGNGEGTIYYSETLQRYVAQYFEPSGKRKTIKQKKNEKVSDFKKRFSNVINSINNNLYIEKSNIIFIDLLNEIIEQKYKSGLVSLCTHNRDIQTKQAIEKVCNNFCYKPVQKITINDIENSKDKIRDYSNSVISKIWIQLNQTFKVAVSRRLIFFNPLDDITMIRPISKKENKNIEALTIEEENKLINILNTSEKDHKYKNAILLQLCTGMRIGELLALSCNDIDNKLGVIHIHRTFTRDNNERLVLGNHTKTFSRKTNIDKGKRDFPITLAVKEILLDINKDNMKNIENLLFWDYRNNSPIFPYEITSYLRRLNKKYNICSQSLTSHILRHTFITRCRENGVDFAVIQKIVGHTKGSSVTNDIYTTVSLEFINKEMNKF